MLRVEITGINYRKIHEGVNFSSNKKFAASKDTCKLDINRVSLNAVISEHPIIRFFIEMVRIPSPSVVPGHPKEAMMHKNLEKVRDVIRNEFKNIGISFNRMENDPYGTEIIRIPGSRGYENYQPIMLMAHTDVVPGSVKEPLIPVNPKLIKEKTEKGVIEYIATDGTNTLGGDDKAGVAIIADAVRKLKEGNRPHVPLEIVFTSDEEVDNASIIKMDSSRLASRNVIIVDNTEAFNVITGCASFVDIRIKIKGLKGGHSALSNANTTISAADILTELKQQLGNRIMAFHPKFPDVPLLSKNIYDLYIQPKPSNAVPTEGFIAMSLRSLRKTLQDKELSRIKKVIKAIEKKYRLLEPGLSIEMKTHEELPPFPEKNRSALAKIARKTAIALGYPDVKVKPFSGGTQANLLAEKTNRYGEKFSTIIVFGPNNPNTHSLNEKVDWRSMVETSKWLSVIIEEFSLKHAKKVSG